MHTDKYLDGNNITTIIAYNDDVADKRVWFKAQGSSKLFNEVKVGSHIEVEGRFTGGPKIEVLNINVLD